MVDWINISSYSGNSGTTVITVTASSYSELIERTTSLTVNTVNTSLSGTVNISQQPRGVVTVIVSPNSISAPVEGGVYTFNIISNGDWTITYPNWTTLSQTAGTGNATITVTIGGNYEDFYVLEGEIVVSTIDNSATVDVHQDRQLGHLSVSPATLEFIYSGGVKTITVTSNTGWFASTECPWIYLNETHQTAMGPSGITEVTVTVSGTSVDRNCTILFEGLDNNATTNVVQYSKVPYLYFEQSALTFDGNGGIQRLKVNSNVEWEIEAGELSGFNIIPRSNGSFRIQQIGGSNNYYANVTYSKNGSALITTSDSISVNVGDMINITKVEKTVSSVGLDPVIQSNFDYDIAGNNSSINCTIRNMFRENRLIDASNFSITDISQITGRGVFKGCSNLENAPKLPATALTDNCYWQMFYGCTSLVNAPALPATTLAGTCYKEMFAGCTSIEKAPELPATTLVSYCYNDMFSGCSNLNYIKCLATDISASGCVSGWVNGVSSVGTFVKDENTTWPTGNSGIPNNWTIISN